MKKQLLQSLLILLAVLFGYQQSTAQTLSAGDIAFIGYDTDANDGFTFIALAPIPAGEVIYFTDKGWNSPTSSWFSNAEDNIEWTAPVGGIACGGIVNITEVGTDAFTTTSGTVIMSVGYSSWSMSAGDQILAYRSGSGVFPASPVFITAIHGDYNSSVYDAATTWSNGISNITTGQSSVPTGLTNGVDCIALFPAPGPELDNNKYTGSLIGTAATVRAMIHNPANWFGTDNPSAPPRLTIMPGDYSASITCPAACVNPDIPTVTFSPTTVCPGSNATLSISGNLNDATQWAVYTGSCGGTLVGTTTSSSFTTASLLANTTFFVRGEGGCVTPSSCGSIAVSVQDITPPTISCPGNQNESFGLSCSFTLPDYTGLATVADNCAASPAVTQSPVAGTVITGTTIITLAANDGNGNTANCTFDVVVSDNINPTISCPGNQNESFGLSCSFTLPDYTGLATVADNCAASPVVTQSPVAGTVITATTVITLTANDGNGNTANCTFDVVVSDNINPTISCPGNQTETATAACNYALPDYAGLATVSDNCAASPTVTQSPIAGTVITGTTTITLTANDGNGNTANCTFDVNLNMSACAGVECSNAIALAPMILCGDTQSVTGTTVGGTPQTEGTCGTSAGTGGANWYTFTGDGGNWTVSTVSGATNYDTKLWVFEGVCGALNCVAGNDDFSGVQSQVTFPTTIGLIYYIVVGGFSGNEGNYDMTIFNAETVAPVADIATLADVTAECTVTSLTAPTATDNCGAVTVTNDATLPINTQGTTIVTWTYSDVNGNSSTQTQNVVITDVTPPTITCPGNQTETPNASCQFPLPDYTGLAIAADNCTASPTVTQSPVAGTMISGTTTITLTTNDGNGNTTNCTFDVVLNDVTAPTAVCQNVNVYLDSIGNATIVASALDGGSTDNCAGLAFSASQTAFTCADLGTNNVTLTVTDGNSNSSNCVAVVTVIDTISPVINCLGNQTATAVTACQFTLIDYTVAATVSASDNCSTLPTITQNPVAGTMVGLGVTIVTLTADDGNGNTTTCNFTVTVSSSATGILDSTICNGASFMFNGTLYDGTNTSGTETLGSSAANGCDSVVTVTVTELPAIDVTVTNASPMLTANATGATYQWLDCDNGNAIIPTGTNQVFTATANGNYAVEITVGSCVDTSACETVLSIGIEDNSFVNQTTIYPNPTTGIFTVSMDELDNNANITVYTVVGKEIVNQQITNNKTIINLEACDKGIYFVKIQNGEITITRRIIKQ